MPIERRYRRLSSERIETAARRLLRASTLCAIATIAPGGRAHVNTAYFAVTTDFGIVWLSAPEARHSRNIRASGTAAIAVYASTQRWGGTDRGIQVFGSARELRGSAAKEAERAYAARFRGYEPGTLTAYRFYRLRTRLLKLFDERGLGGGAFITARILGGRAEWVATEQYRSDE